MRSTFNVGLYIHKGVDDETEGKNPLARCRYGWNCNINTELKGIGWNYMAWINLSWIKSIELFGNGHESSIKRGQHFD
jgi:hypothetical protein